METEELVEPDLPPATLSEGLLSEDEDFKVETFLKDPVVRVERVNYIFLYKPILIILFSVQSCKEGFGEGDQWERSNSENQKGELHICIYKPM